MQIEQKRNALGQLVQSFSKEKKNLFYRVAIEIRPDYTFHRLRQYFYLNSDSNPYRIDRKVQEELVKRVDKRFEGVFITNHKYLHGLEKKRNALPVQEGVLMLFA